MKADLLCCIGIIDKCMLKCRMCYKWLDGPIKEHPTLEQYQRFISDLAEFAGKNVKINFAGGEALLFKGVLDLVNSCAQKGFWSHIPSNGWLINEDMAKRIADSGLTEISLSLDSLDETIHDYLRGVKGVHRKVMDAIGYLRKYSGSIRINICCVIYDWNLDGLIPLLEWVNNNDEIRGISVLAPMQPNSTGVDREWWEGKFGYLWPRDTNKVLFFIDKLIEYKKSGAKIGTPLASLEEFKLYFRYRQAFVQKPNCNLIPTLELDASGQIFLCPKMDITVGSIKGNISLKELLNSNKAKDVRQKISTCQNNCHFLLNRFL